jgi:dipeptidyl aminopeptidase/acylaminoacyl peptidase
MKKNFLLSLTLFLSLQVVGQVPDTDIFLSTVSNDSGKITFSAPVNLTRRKGYDNQPSFTPDGKKFYFVSVNKDTTQSDIYLCDLKERRVSRVTNSVTSEYSPMLTPDGKGISVVRVDPDSSQRFYVLPLDEPRVSIHVDNSDSIGYYAWTNDSVIAMFVLEGKKNSLQLLNIRSGERRRIAPEIGRCLKTDSDRRQLYFTDKSDDSLVVIMSMDLLTGEKRKVIPCISGSEDFEVMKDGSLLQGSSARLYQATPGSTTWTQVADFSSSVKDFYRIAIDPTGRLLALVVYTGEKP